MAEWTTGLVRLGAGHYWASQPAQHPEPPQPAQSPALSTTPLRLVSPHRSLGIPRRLPPLASRSWPPPPDAPPAAPTPPSHTATPGHHQSTTPPVARSGSGVGAAACCGDWGEGAAAGKEGGAIWWRPRGTGRQSATSESPTRRLEAAVFNPQPKKGGSFCSPVDLTPSPPRLGLPAATSPAASCRFCCCLQAGSCRPTSASPFSHPATDRG